MVLHAPQIHLAHEVANQEFVLQGVERREQDCPDDLAGIVSADRDIDALVDADVLDAFLFQFVTELAAVSACPISTPRTANKLWSSSLVTPFLNSMFEGLPPSTR